MQPIRRALISVSDKRDLVGFARALRELGVEIVSTGGTASELEQAGIDVVRVEQLSGVPDMMGGRVKTLHPAVHGAILARRDVADDMAALDTRGFRPIDLVCVNLYPFEQAIEPRPADAQCALEQIDIGGPALIRAAAKNHRFVTVVISPDQYEQVIRELQANNGSTSLELRQELAAAAFARTAAYDSAIAGWMGGEPHELFPQLLRLSFTRRCELRYGENPHQKAALYAAAGAGGSSVVTAELLHGKPLSYNNVHDAAAALALVSDLNASFAQHASAAVVKHTSPCGAAIAERLADAFDRAYHGDPLAAYGGILALGREVDEATARLIRDGQKFFDVIIAPGYDEEALQALKGRWKNVRLLAVGAPATSGGGIEFKSVPGGVLAQQRDTQRPDVSAWQHAAGPAASRATLQDAALAWTLVKHLKSNAIAIGRGGALVGAAAGQVDRVTACRIAAEKAGDKLRGEPAAVAASDAFFPFTDGPKLLIDAGVRCLVHPGGSKRDQETIELCEQHNVTCLLTGVRHFRH
ncbi:MAG: bifunctional phosphoribosylaminoimidazolecarboxamide formyltransferase/IMP cyclohydrolase [Planctomycetota bacterium]|jgi:phosphoribosylaminoimidazolecarboxamide formyltransferase/IMP cyclohydrolase